MAKEYKAQKKKTPLTTFLDILFKILVAVAVIIFSFIAYQNISFNNVSLGAGALKKNEDTASSPQKLRWFNDFKGIENVPDKNTKKEKKRESSGSSTGFNYQGFGK